MNATEPLRFRSREGATMFAWLDGHDPVDVMVEAAWAWAEPDKQSVCRIPHCPTAQGGYCLECHGVACDITHQARKLLAAGVSA